MPDLAAPPSVETGTCPKCGYPADPAVGECPGCGVVIEKARKLEAERAAEREHESSGWLATLAAAKHVTVKQEVERLEAWTGIETANAYRIEDGRGTFFLHAAEESGSVGGFFVRNWLKAARPFTMRIETMHGEPVVLLKRPFRFFFSEIHVHDVNGKQIGFVQRQFSVFNSVYKLLGRRRTDRYEIHGPFFRPWTFRIERHGRECGVIRKRWGGLRREMLTDADNFGIEFPPDASAVLKAVFLGALFLIDFAHFEENHRG